MPQSTEYFLVSCNTIMPLTAALGLFVEEEVRGGEGQEQESLGSSP